MNQLIKIPGHSGSKLVINFDNSHGLIVKKISNEKRLEVQAKKQEMFLLSSMHDNITSPKITKSCFVNEQKCYEFHMKYIVGSDIISFLSQSSTQDIQEFTKTLFEYFSKITNTKVFKSANKDINKKIKSVRSLLCSNPHIKNSDKIQFLMNTVDNLYLEVNSKDIVLPVGNCHGDLTFSNMIYNPHSKKIVLFDFLDTYFESPVQDMIKIKQDLKHNWTLQKMTDHRGLDKNRFEIVKRYLDDTFENYFKSFDYYCVNYKLLQTLNLLRVLVYSKDCTTINFLLECIKRV